MPLTLQELSIHIPGAISVLERYGIDYYRNGSRTLRTACLERGLSFETVDAELSRLEDPSAPICPLTLEDMSADRLIDYINGRFHDSEEHLLQAIAEALHGRFSENEQRIADRIAPAFESLRESLLAHCRREDELLFPWMRRLVTLHRTKSLKKLPGKPSIVSNPVALLKEEHAAIVLLEQAVRDTAENFHIPAAASAAYMQLMRQLDAFGRDFHMHLHIENNILFPKLIALEQELTVKNA